MSGVRRVEEKSRGGHQMGVLSLGIMIAMLRSECACEGDGGAGPAEVLEFFLAASPGTG